MEPIMKMNKKLLMLSATFAIAAQFDSIAIAASVDGAATAEVIAPLTISEFTAMDFGEIAPHLTIADTITMDTSGNRSADGGDAETIGGVGTPATFEITGKASQNFSLSYTAGVLSNGTDTMAVNGFTDNDTGTLTGGTDRFQVGATIALGINQATGTYSTASTGGSAYTVTINYD